MLGEEVRIDFVKITKPLVHTAGLTGGAGFDVALVPTQNVGTSNGQRRAKTNITGAKCIAQI